MQKIQLSNDLFIAHFPSPDEPEKLTIDIPVFLHGNKALLLDCGYEPEARQLKAELDDAGVTVEKIVLSHYHPDHFEGRRVFPESELWVSAAYHWVRQRWDVRFPEMDKPEATHEIQSGEALQFGAHTLHFSAAPGHSRCSLVTAINGEMLHVGDLLMFSDAGILSAPFIGPDGDHADYLLSLQMLEEHAVQTIIPAHGMPFKDPAQKQRVIERLRHYIQTNLDSHGTLPVESCLGEKPENWINLRFHKQNCKRFSA